MAKYMLNKDLGRALIANSLVIIPILLLISNCQFYYNWRNPEELQQITSLNRALYLCMAAQKWNDAPPKEFYDQYYKLKSAAGPVWSKFAVDNKLLYSGPGTNGSQIIYRDMISNCDRAIGNAFAIYSVDQNMQKESDYAKSLGYAKGIFGYQDKNYDAGITNFINYVYHLSATNSHTKLSKTIEDNRGFLIKMANSDHDFVVSGIVGNYIIYRYFDKSYHLVQVALVKDRDESYIEESPLIGKYFAVLGTKKIILKSGKVFEILVIKKIE